MHDDDTTAAEFRLCWSQDDAPGVPLLVLVVTTQGIAPMFLEALTMLSFDQQTAVAADMAVALHRAADQLGADVAMVRAVEDAMGDDDA
jgi:hypothetical protein